MSNPRVKFGYCCLLYKNLHEKIDEIEFEHNITSCRLSDSIHHYCPLYGFAVVSSACFRLPQSIYLACQIIIKALADLVDISLGLTIPCVFHFTLLPFLNLNFNSFVQSSLQFRSVSECEQNLHPHKQGS